MLVCSPPSREHPATHCHTQLEAACTGWALQKKRTQPNVNQCEIKLLSPISFGGRHSGLLTEPWGCSALVPVGKPRALLSLRAGRATRSSSCQPARPLGLLPAFSLPAFSPCLTAPERRSPHTAAIQHFLVAAAEHTRAGCCRQCGRALPGGRKEGDVLQREMDPISLDHQMSPEVEQVASRKASVPPIKQRKYVSKGRFFQFQIVKLSAISRCY